MFKVLFGVSAESSTAYFLRGAARVAATSRNFLRAEASSPHPGPRSDIASKDGVTNPRWHLCHPRRVCIPR